MNKKAVVLLILLNFLLCTNIAQGQISLGVKKGDWVEYNVTTIGTPPTEQNVVWVRMEVIDVQGTKFSTNVTTEFPNGTRASGIRSFDFEVGNVQSWIIIPANLSLGESFYDASTGRNVTIESEEQRTVAGAVRTVTSASIPSMHKRWDKATGFFVETIDNLGTYQLNATAIATNLWSPEPLLEPASFNTIVIAAAVVIAVAAGVIVLVARRKK